MGEADSTADEAALLEMALNDPVSAIEEAATIIERDQRDRAYVVALRARGAARRRLGEFADSEVDLRSALIDAEQFGGPNLWAEVALTLAGTLVHLGNIDEAIELLHRGIDCATGRALAESRYQLGTTHAQAGDLDAAVAEYERALPLIRQVGETDWEGGLLGNRGTMNIYRGDYDAAVDDLTAGLALLRRTASGPAQIALFMNNLAYALHLRGDVGASLDLYAESEALQASHDLPTAMYAHKANAYLSVGMYEETLELAHEAHQFHRRGNAVVGAIEALLAGADAALALQRYALAAELASTAKLLDDDAGFPVWRARAELIELDVEVRTGAEVPGYSSRVESMYAAASGADAVVAARSLLVGARAALCEGNLADADDLLARVSLDDDPTGSVAIERCRIAAELAFARGDSGELRRVVDDGLARFDLLIDASLSYDTSHKVARHISRLTELGVRAGLERSDVRTATEIIERVRAAGLPKGDEIGDPPPHTDTLTWTNVEGELIRVVGPDLDHVVRCGAVDEISSLVREQQFALRQLARRSSLSSSSVDDLDAQVAQASELLAARLLPVDMSPRVILNPPDVLTGVAWGALPSLQDVEHVVAPSAWHGARTVGASFERVAVLASSDLLHATDEAHSIAADWLREAHVDPVEPIRVVDGTDLAHVAGHFLNDSENPLLSRIPLGGTSLRGADLLAMASPPRVLVLSACSSGSTAAVGPAQVGFATAALAAGVRCVVTTAAPVEDSERLAELMRALHELLRRGSSPAAALRRLRTDADPAMRQLASTFGIYGAGW